jgi:endonuclease YncB( thermonuclease family)
MRRFALLPLLFVALAASAAPKKPAAAPPLQGKATQVIDGATFVLQTTEGKQLTVQLAGIEPPEPCQTWGAESKDALQAWLKDQPLQLKTEGGERGGRVLAHVFVDGADINVRMVEEGHAFSVRGRSDHGPYLKQERVAKALRRGMFSVGPVELPASFRRGHGPCQPGATATAKAAR